MKIITSSNSYNYSYRIPKTKPSFSGLFYKNSQPIKLSKEVQKQILEQGLSSIKKIKSGEFGTVCKDSVPLPNFYSYIQKNKLFNIVQNGISTNKEGFAYSFLKTQAQNPISTSFVHDCSVMYLFNKDTNTHLLYHSMWNTPKKKFKYLIQDLMPEGVTRAGIAPGCNLWTRQHAWTIPDMFNAIRETNPNAIINVYHNNSLYPEIVGHNGKLFEIPNKNIHSQNIPFPIDYGQASFKISDIQEYQTLDRIEEEWISTKELKQLKKMFNERDYDPEIKKILNQLIDKYLALLGERNSKQIKIGLLKEVISNRIRNIKDIYTEIIQKITKIFV